MQLHWLAFGEIHCSTESVTISTLANWFIQENHKKNDFVYTQMRVSIVIYMDE